MQLRTRPILAVTLGYLLGITVLILVPNLVETLFFRSNFAEFGSRWGTAVFDLFIWALLAVPSSLALALALVGLERRLSQWSPRVRFLSGTTLGLAVGVVAGVGLWEDFAQAVFPRGLFGMIAASALTGVAAAACLAAVSSVGSALRRQGAVSS